MTPLSTAPSPPSSQFTVCTSRFAHLRFFFGRSERIPQDSRQMTARRPRAAKNKLPTSFCRDAGRKKLATSLGGLFWGSKISLETAGKKEKQGEQHKEIKKEETENSTKGATIVCRFLLAICHYTLRSETLTYRFVTFSN